MTKGRKVVRLLGFNTYLFMGSPFYSYLSRFSNNYNEVENVIYK